MYEQWANGYGVIQHTAETRARLAGQPDEVYAVLHALDRVCSATMWLVVHETYARNVYLDGRALAREDFKPKPEGHTGGALNMVPAYAGYLAANVISQFTRGWLMGQGHCVAAIDTLNLLVDNMLPAHAERYQVTDAGLTRYVRDFYSYETDSPLGSHVNAHTAGGLMEGGYLGFAELQYVHMPLPGERLVAFLSDGAFEEQRGSDWAPRWWRPEDCGWAMPIMIQNGRRIDQRTTMSQQGGAAWFSEHLKLNGFDPFIFDGRDPAAFVWAILEMERRLEARPSRLPYGIAVAPKGAGFPGEGTNLAHNLPLLANPAVDAAAAARFHEGAAKLWVPPGELRAALERFVVRGREKERDNPFTRRNPEIHALEELPSRESGAASPMEAIDETFSALVRRNPQLRPRVGNPDEMKSNRLIRTLDLLRFRVTDPEPGLPESVHGAVITALNEEAVVSAALANKGGINLVHTYEAFGPKMLGAVRQEVIFAQNLAAAGRPAQWISVPVIMTSHTWENGKNEHSHQDTTFAEAMAGERAPFSRVLFPADFNTAAAVAAGVFATRGQIWTIVAPKCEVPTRFTPEQAARMLADGSLELRHDEGARILLAAAGAYQLDEVLRASAELAVPHAVRYLLEPARVRLGALPAVVLSHTRGHVLHGLLAPGCEGPLEVLGYRNAGGTLSPRGMLEANGCTWRDVLAAVTRRLDC